MWYYLAIDGFSENRQNAGDIVWLCSILPLFDLEVKGICPQDEPTPLIDMVMSAQSKHLTERDDWNIG
jgi:hypothetical protein